MMRWTKAPGRTVPPLGSAEEAPKPGRWEGLQGRGKLEGCAASPKPSWMCRSQGFVLIPLTPPRTLELPRGSKESKA